MSLFVRLQAAYGRLALGLASLGCLIALVLLLFLGFHTDAPLDGDVPVDADATVAQPSESESNPRVSDPQASQAQAIERARQQLASLQNHPDLLVSSTPIVLDAELLGSPIDILHAPDELLTSCPWCPELFPTDGAEQRFAYGRPMGVAWILSGGGRSSGGGSGEGADGGGAAGGGGGSGGGGSSSGQQTPPPSSPSSDTDQSDGDAAEQSGDPTGNSNDDNSDPTGEESTPAGEDSETLWLPTGDGRSDQSDRETGSSGPTSVPEPSVLLLTIIGLGSLAGTRRFARRSR